MSYCRFGEADIYLYESIYGGFECCMCSLSEGDTWSTIMKTRMEVLFHVRQHRAIDDYVPDEVDFRLLQEIKAENPDKSMTDLSDLYEKSRLELLENLDLFDSSSDVSVITSYIINKAVKHLRDKAEESAKSSRDFGRGYMHAVRELESFLKP